MNSAIFYQRILQSKNIDNSRRQRHLIYGVCKNIYNRNGFPMRVRTRQLSGRSCGRLSRKSIRRRNRFPLTIRRPKHLCLPESWSARTAGILWLPPAKHSAGKMALSSTILLISAPGLPLPDTASAPGTGFLRSA